MRQHITAETKEHYVGEQTTFIKVSNRSPDSGRINLNSYDGIRKNSMRKLTTWVMAHLIGDRLSARIILSWDSSSVTWKNRSKRKCMADNAVVTDNKSKTLMQLVKRQWKPGR